MNRDPLDTALGSLPRDVQPSRDLWRGIEAEISSAPVDLPSSPRHPVTTSLVWRMAAGVLLVVASSLVTYVITREQTQQDILQAQRVEAMQQPAVAAMPVSFGGQQVLGPEYMRAREALDAEFQRQVATLPPVTRAKLERNLADLRRTASEISATLAEHPSHPLLQELLLSTYQSELALLGSVTEMNTSDLMLPVNETRL